MSICKLRLICYTIHNSTIIDPVNNPKAKSDQNNWKIQSFKNKILENEFGELFLQYKKTLPTHLEIIIIYLTSLNFTKRKRFFLPDSTIVFDNSFQILLESNSLCYEQQKNNFHQSQHETTDCKR